jgi:hypothetical protein
MPFEWKELLDLAREMEREAVAGAGNAETLFRSAVSRAYFGAFCHVRNYAQTYLNFHSRKDQDDHGRLRAHFKGKHSANGVRLDRLRKWRNQADYMDTLPWSDFAVETAIALAEAQKLFNSRTPPASAAGA